MCVCVCIYIYHSQKRRNWSVANRDSVNIQIAQHGRKGSSPDFDSLNLESNRHFECMFNVHSENASRLKAFLFPTWVFLG